MNFIITSSYAILSVLHSLYRYKFLSGVIFLLFCKIGLLTRSSLSLYLCLVISNTEMVSLHAFAFLIAVDCFRYWMLITLVVGRAGDRGAFSDVLIQPRRQALWISGYQGNLDIGVVSSQWSFPVPSDRGSLMVWTHDVFPAPVLD